MTKVYANLVVAVMFSLSAGGALGEGKTENHTHEFARDVDDFHTALAPLWHANPGEARTQNVCDQAEELENLAARIHSGDPKALLSSIGELRAKCGTVSPDIDAAFSQVHHEFHKLVEHRER